MTEAESDRRCIGWRVSESLQDVERQITQEDLRGAPGYCGWVLGNVLSFLEGGLYGGDYVEDQRDVEPGMLPVGE